MIRRSERTPRHRRPTHTIRNLLAVIAATATLAIATTAGATELTPVTPPAPTFTDPTCDANYVQHDEEQVEGIVWHVDDSHEGGRLTLTVTAEAVEGYVVVGRDTWTWTYAGFPECGDEAADGSGAESEELGLLPRTGR